METRRIPRLLMDGIELCLSIIPPNYGEIMQPKPKPGSIGRTVAKFVNEVLNRLEARADENTEEIQNLKSRLEETTEDLIQRLETLEENAETIALAVKNLDGDVNGWPQ